MKLFPKLFLTGLRVPEKCPALVMSAKILFRDEACCQKEVNTSFNDATMIRVSIVQQYAAAVYFAHSVRLAAACLIGGVFDGNKKKLLLTKLRSLQKDFHFFDETNGQENAVCR